MFDFLRIKTRKNRGVTEIYPGFRICNSKDLMIRGGDFYAIWVEEKQVWSTDEMDAIRIIDEELDHYEKEHHDNFDSGVRVLYIAEASTGMIDQWHKYCQRQMRDSYHVLDEKLIFLNDKPKKEDYSSQHLDYALKEGEHESYDKLMSVLYSPEEKAKIEWAIGSIVHGDSRNIQKFMVLYGAAGTGKSTVLRIIQMLFAGYYSVFDAKALGSSSNSFALEAFRGNPLVAIQHDGDLSRIEDNTRLNSLVSHEAMIVNEKFKSTYSNAFHCFLFMGTNKPVKITDAKSGLIRRLIDVTPTGNKVAYSEYCRLMRNIEFELGAIAYYCRDVYMSDPERYDNYIPATMLGASNDFYNFVIDAYPVFKREDGTTLKAAWEMYKTYCDDANVSYPYSQRAFKEELKNYFRNFEERFSLDDGTRVRSYYSGFRYEKFEQSSHKESSSEQNDIPAKSWLDLDIQGSLFDDIYADCPAQYSNAEGHPVQKWDNVTTKLRDLDTTKEHYVLTPKELITVDFDLKDENGNKNLEKNLEAAAKWPPTYAELSKSGFGVHLEYIYTGGDPGRIKRIYDKDIEIKVAVGKSSLRRRLTKCNTLPIAEINSGLPLKEEDYKMISFDGVKNEQDLRRRIEKNLNRGYHANTKPSVDYICFLLNDTYKRGMHYDVTDMRNRVLIFAAESTNHAAECIKMVNKAPFKSEDASEWVDNDKSPIVFFDCEVFPNLLVVCWKLAGANKPVNSLINPTQEEIEGLLKFRLIGFNCRKYDNHILYARLIGYTCEQLYKLSRNIIINKSKNSMFGEAYNISYTDVYDFCAKKQSLKKWEIQLGIHHQELGVPWDEPVAEELWSKVAEYCCNDVVATEAAFNANQADFTARKILADLAGMSVNDTTNTLTARIIFGKDRKPQSQFNYRNLAEKPLIGFTCEDAIEYAFGKRVKPAGMPYFPGYSFEHGVSTYRGETIGEGGKVFARPGMWTKVNDQDVSSMHPNSIKQENLFGDTYTKNFVDLVDIRIHIKHQEFDIVRGMMGGKLEKYLTDEASAKALSGALKIAINSVYGLTAAKFDNQFRDIRNIDNIVAKRGALFMTDLKYALETYFKDEPVIHIKTDSIKIANASPEVVTFVQRFGEAYGYSFETEAVFDRICLVNDAVFVAKIDGGEWTATGEQFKVPYVFKTLFSKEPVTFEDMCEVKSVSTAMYLDMNENLAEDEHNYIFVGKVGEFCPIAPGHGGGTLLRLKSEKQQKTGGLYSAVEGTKGYKWLESEAVRILGKENDIDRSYYDKLVDAAVNDISQFGDFEWFTDDVCEQVVA